MQFLTLIITLSILLIPLLLFFPSIRHSLKAKQALYIYSSLYFLFIAWVSFTIYTSLYKCMSWYEPCGMQFMIVIIFSAPALILVGIVNIILGRFLKMSVLAKVLPFIIALGLGLPPFIDGSLGRGMQLTGTYFSIAGALGVVIVTVKDIIKINKQNKVI